MAATAVGATRTGRAFCAGCGGAGAGAGDWVAIGRSAAAGDGEALASSPSIFSVAVVGRVPGRIGSAAARGVAPTLFLDAESGEGRGDEATGALALPSLALREPFSADAAAMARPDAEAAARGECVAEAGVPGSLHPSGRRICCTVPSRNSREATAAWGEGEEEGEEEGRAPPVRKGVDDEDERGSRVPVAAPGVRRAVTSARPPADAVRPCAALGRGVAAAMGDAEDIGTAIGDAAMPRVQSCSRSYV